MKQNTVVKVANLQDAFIYQEQQKNMYKYKM